jgi:hypothetical protein
MAVTIRGDRITEIHILADPARLAELQRLELRRLELQGRQEIQ